MDMYKSRVSFSSSTTELDIAAQAWQRGDWPGLIGRSRGRGDGGRAGGRSAGRGGREGLQQCRGAPIRITIRCGYLWFFCLPVRASGKGAARCVYGDNKRGVFVGFIWSGFKRVPDNAMEWVEEWDKFDDEGFTNVRDIMDDLGYDVPPTTKSAYSAPWGNDKSFFNDGFDFSSDPGLPGEDVKAGQDKEGLSRSEKGRGFGDSPEHEASTSHSEARDYAFNSSIPNGRFSSVVESDGDAFYGQATFDSGNESLRQGQSAFDSRDPFGDGGLAWGFHDEDSNADFRASWR